MIKGRWLAVMALVPLVGCSSGQRQVAASNSSRSAPTARSTSATGPASSAATHLTYGVSVFTLARLAGMKSPSPDPAPADPAFPSSGDLMGPVNGVKAAVVTFANADDEVKAAGALQVASAYLPPGEHWYAGGDGWFGYGSAFDKPTAEFFAKRLGGSIKQIG